MILVILAGFLVAASWLCLIGLGAVVMWRGLRGRAADRYPHCRRCGYALVGASHLPPRCPECGLVIDGQRTCRSSPRVRRWSLVAGGAMAITALTAPLGLMYLAALVRPAAAAAAKLPNPPATAPQTPGAPGAPCAIVVIPYIQERPAGLACPICGQASPGLGHVHTWPGGANDVAGALRPGEAELEGPPAPAIETESAEEPRDEPTP